MFNSVRIGLLGMLALGLTGCDSSDIEVPNWPWQVHKPVPHIGRACATSFVINNKAYVLLGRRGEILEHCQNIDSNTYAPNCSENGMLLSDMFQYDPVTDQWTQKQDFPGEPRVFPIAATVPPYAFVGLGYNHQGIYNDSSYLRDFWKYNPMTDSWTRMADFPGAGVNAAVCWVYNEEIYVAHGFGLSNFFRDVWKYQPQNNRWVQLAPFPSWGRTGGVVSASEGRIFTGTGYSARNNNDWWEYFPSQDLWIKRENMPDLGRINGLGFSVADRYFVGTGRYFAGMLTVGHLKDDLVEYDPHTNLWIQRGRIPGGGRENALSFVINDRVFIAFGENLDGTLNDMYSLTLP